MCVGEVCVGGVSPLCVPPKISALPGTCELEIHISVTGQERGIGELGNEVASTAFPRSHLCHQRAAIT